MLLKHFATKSIDFALKDDFYTSVFEGKVYTPDAAEKRCSLQSSSQKTNNSPLSVDDSILMAAVWPDPIFDHEQPQHAERNECDVTHEANLLKF